MIDGLVDSDSNLRARPGLQPPLFFFFHAQHGTRDLVRSRVLGDCVYETAVSLSLCLSLSLSLSLSLCPSVSLSLFSLLYISHSADDHALTLLLLDALKTNTRTILKHIEIDATVTLR